MKKIYYIPNTRIKPLKYVRNSKFILKNSCYSEILLKYYQTTQYCSYIKKQSSFNKVKSYEMN